MKKIQIKKMQMNQISMESFQNAANLHLLWSHPFLNRAKSGQLTLAEVKVLAIQMYKFSKEFNRILASIMSYCPDEEAQFVILENLFDEMGQGNLGNSHPSLFRHFSRALGISDLSLEESLTTPETQYMIDTYLSLARKYGYLAALGGVCYASEGIVNTLYSHLQRGIEKATAFTKKDLIFFEVHIDLDQDHAAHLAQLIQPRLITSADCERVTQAIKTAMDARVHFFDGIQKKFSTLSTLSLSREVVQLA